MENGMMNTNGSFDWNGIIGLLIIAGIFGYGNGFGFGGNSARADITNEFLFNQMSNDIRANGQAINTVDRDVLTTSCNTDKEIMQNRFDNQLAFSNQNQLLQSCCCEIKNAIHSEGEETRALIQANTIQDLRDKVADKDRELLATGLSYSNTIATNNATDKILSNLGKYVPYVNYYPYMYGTTIQ